MKNILTGVAILFITIAILLITGVINENYLLLYFGLAGTPADITEEKIRLALDAWNRDDWKSLSSISTSFLHSALLVYFVRSLFYVSATLFLLIWLRPVAKMAFEILRQLEGNLYSEYSDQDDITRKESIVKSLRVRAARKRVESYVSLCAALLSLALAIGFVTRDNGSGYTGHFDNSTTSTDSALSQADRLAERAL